MSLPTVELQNVIYNAASQCFEGLATVHAGPASRSIACAINAPIDMSFKDASQGLSAQALRRFNGASELSASIPQNTQHRQTRAGRAPARKVMDAFEMLRRLAA